MVHNIPKNSLSVFVKFIEEQPRENKSFKYQASFSGALKSGIFIDGKALYSRIECVITGKVNN